MGDLAYDIVGSVPEDFQLPIISNDVGNNYSLKPSARTDIIVEFFYEQKLDKKAKEKKLIRHYARECVRISKVGEPKTNFCGLANEISRDHDRPFKEVYAREYNLWKMGKGQIGGTPLEHWSYLDSSQIASLHFYNIRTVEQAAALPDSAEQGLGGLGKGLKEKAKEFLNEIELKKKIGKEQKAKEAKKAKATKLVAKSKEGYDEFAKELEEQLTKDLEELNDDEISDE